jgi:hypothetical protein
MPVCIQQRSHTYAAAAFSGTILLNVKMKSENKLRMKRLSAFLSTAMLLVTLVSTTVPAYAANTSSGLSITPRKNLNINPGQTVTDKLTIGNLNANADLNITLHTIDFTYMNDSGTPKLLLAKDAPQTAWSLKPYIKLPDSVVIPAGQSKTVQYSITIPAGQGAGSYYSAIQYGTGGPNGGNVNLSASGVSLVFVSVPGIVKESMTLKKFGAYAVDKDQVTGKYVFIAMNKLNQIGYTLQNDGNVAEAPEGSILVKYMLGGKQWNIENANANSSLALRGQARLFTACFESTSKTTELGGEVTRAKVCKQPALWPGRYTMTLDAFYGQNGNNTHEINATAHFWYLPLWFMAVVLAILLLLGITITIIVRKIRRATRGPAYGTRRR